MFDADVQRQIVSAGLDDLSPNAMLPNRYGGEFGPTPQKWRADIKQKMRQLRWIIVLAILGLSRGVAASPATVPRYGIFVYSNLCTSALSGDIYGARITLRRLADGDSVIYEYTDGNTHLIVADNLVLDQGSGKLRFEAHAPGNLNAEVIGEISDAGEKLTIRGLFFDEKATVILPLVKNYSTKLPSC